MLEEEWMKMCDVLPTVRNPQDDHWAVFWFSQTAVISIMQLFSSEVIGFRDSLVNEVESKTEMRVNILIL